MQVSVFVSKTYALRSMAGGVLANEKGEVLETLEPGQQLHVTALEPVWVLPDDCQMAMVNFKQAARALGMLAGGNKELPAGYTKLDFLESTGTQYIDTGLKPGADSLLSVKHSFTTDATNQMVLGCELKSNAETGIGGIRNNTLVHATNWYSGGKRLYWRYGVLNGEAHNYLGNSVKGVLYDVALQADGVYVNGEKKLNRGVYTGDESARYIYLFAANTDNANNKGSVRVYYFQMSSNGKQVNFIPAIDPTGTPCMYDLVTRKPFYNSGTGQFIAGFTMNQALNLAKLPATGGSLTISLPKEATLVQHNQQVEAALETAAEKGWNIPVQYRDKFDDESILNKYAECVTDTDIIAVNAKRGTDLTEENEWIYPLPKLKTIKSAYLFAQSPMVSFNSELPELEKGTYMFYQATKLKEWNKDLPKLTDARYLFEQAHSLKRFSGKLPLLTNWDKIFYKASGLTDFDSDVSSCSSGEYMFHNTKLNKTSALRVLNGIPRWTSGTHKLTIGIHIDHQNDEEVLAAIALADIAQTPIEEGGKGWTVTVQWNGTPTAQTASTFGLRKPPIYAKLATSERPDGTTENFLDWGHYVSNWEENGYQEFASIEEAEEHFNIKKEITE